MADRQLVVPWWYHAVTGLIAGAAIVATALLSRQVAGIFLVAAALVVGVISRIAAKSSGTRLPVSAGAAGIGYLVALTVVVIGSLIVAWSVIRPDGPDWLAWVLAAVVFVVTLGGAWVTKAKRAA
ncbi:hypothetical protein ACIBTW_20325 [Micromonospora parva]|uniref:hypothetical protein n=1 Tax=Micromonospora parva TaxID=1464048 RepID=UPI0037A24086